MPVKEVPFLRGEENQDIEGLWLRQHLHTSRKGPSVVWVFAVTSFLVGVALGGTYLGTSAIGQLTGQATYYSGGTGCNSVPPTGWSAQTPYPRAGAAIAYDTATGQQYALMFGGITSNVNTPLGDTWEYRSGCWYRYCTSCTAGTTEPAARYAGTISYDAYDAEFVLFGGCALDYGYEADGCNSSASANFLGDTWVWSDSCQSGLGTTGSSTGCWSKLAITLPNDQNAVAGLYGQSMVYDSQSAQCNGIGHGCVIMWGGGDFHSTDNKGPCDYSTYDCNDYGYYFSGGTWTKFPPSYFTGYSGAAFASAAYASSLNEILYFGGVFNDQPGTCHSISECPTYQWQVYYTGGATTTYSASASAQPWTVPNGVTSISVDMAGAVGNAGTGGTTNGAGGNGGRVQATISVTATHVLNMYVSGTVAEWNAGSGGTCGTGNGGTGGGFTAIYDSTTSTYLAVAGGGGGGGGAWSTSYTGANGGSGGSPGSAGGNGDAGTGGGGGLSSSSPGTAGTGYVNGGTAGSALVGGNGGCSVGDPGGGGGGGGWDAGGGGGDGNFRGNGGGGGNSYVASGGVEYTSGYETGNGYMKITPNSGTSGDWSFGFAGSSYESCSSPSPPTLANGCPWPQEMGAAIYDTSGAGALGGNAPQIVLYGGNYYAIDGTGTANGYLSDQWTAYWPWSPGTTNGGSGSFGNYVTMADVGTGPGAFYDPSKAYIVSVGGYDYAIGDNLGIEDFN